MRSRFRRKPSHWPFSSGRPLGTRRARPLGLESLETRRMFVVELVVRQPVVSAFLAHADATGLKVEVSSQPAVVLTIDNAGVRQAIKEIDGVLYSVQGTTVYQTSASTGATQTSSLTPLAGTTGIEVRDITLVNGEVTFVGGSITGDTAPTRRTIATKWDLDGIPTRLGPAGVTGLANFVTTDGLIGGFYEKPTGQYTPWVSSPLGEFDLSRSELPQTIEQMATRTSNSGEYLAGFEGDWPMIWQASAAPEAGRFDLIVSSELPLEYPDDAIVGSAGRRYRVLEESRGDYNIFGQYDVPVINQGQVVGLETHSAMWSISGARLYDFGPNTEMLGVQNVGSTYVVAHRNSISIIDELSVSVITLDELLPGNPPPGVTQTILDGGLLLAGSPDQPMLGINFSESSATFTRNKIALVALKRPETLELDIEDDGIFDAQFFDQDMAFSSFIPIGYGQRDLRARVTYSDGSTATAVTRYEALPFASVPSGNVDQLLFGGTKGDDQAAISWLGGNSYRTTAGTRTQDFSDIDSIVIDLSSGSDTLLLAGGILFDLATLAGVETLDSTGTSVETIAGIDSETVGFQVGPTGTMLMKVDPQDVVELLPGWTLREPELVNGRATARLTAGAITLLLQTGNFTNPFNDLDTTFDNSVTARDALLVINYLNQVSGGANPPIDAYLDVNNNGFITALDVLLIINHINSQGAAEGAGATTSNAVVSWQLFASSLEYTPADLDSLPNQRRRRSAD
ncbi:MAG: hypothetical protein IT423_04765 [Pirellulaceae bacterium]|nr:hypothetical protein [Pirellulaceae bacterium]